MFSGKMTYHFSSDPRELDSSKGLTLDRPHSEIALSPGVERVALVVGTTSLLFTRWNASLPSEPVSDEERARRMHDPSTVISNAESIVGVTIEPAVQFNDSWEVCGPAAVSISGKRGDRKELFPRIPSLTIAKTNYGGVFPDEGPLLKLGDAGFRNVATELPGFAALQASIATDNQIGLGTSIYFQLGQDQEMIFWRNGDSASASSATVYEA